MLVHNKNQADIAGIQEAAKDGLFTTNGVKVYNDDYATINSISGPNRGVIIANARTAIGDTPADVFESLLPGHFKPLSGIGSKGQPIKVTPQWMLRFDNLITGGTRAVNGVKFDGRQYIDDLSAWSKTFYDSKRSLGMTQT